MKGEFTTAMKHAGFSEEQADLAYDTFVYTLRQNLADGGDGRALIEHFGSFTRVKRAARVGRNLQTGAPVNIPVRYDVKFTASPTLKKHLGVPADE